MAYEKLSFWDLLHLFVGDGYAPGAEGPEGLHEAHFCFDPRGGDLIGNVLAFFGVDRVPEGKGFTCKCYVSAHKIAARNREGFIGNFHFLWGVYGFMGLWVYGQLECYRCEVTR